MAFNPQKTLRVKYSKREKDWVVDYPSKATGAMTFGFLDGQIDFPEFLEELKSRGYDIHTLKLSVSRRSFLCVNDYIQDDKVIFKKESVYFLKHEDENGMGIVTHDGFVYSFLKDKDTNNYVYSFFTEKK